MRKKYSLKKGAHSTVCFCACTNDTPPSGIRACAESLPDPRATILTTRQACDMAAMSPQMLNKHQRLGLFRVPLGRKRGLRQLYSLEDVERMRALEFLKRLLGLQLLKEFLDLERSLAHLFRSEGPGVVPFFEGGRPPSWSLLDQKEREGCGPSFNRYIDLRFLIYQRIGSPELISKARLNGQLG